MTAVMFAFGSDYLKREKSFAFKRFSFDQPVFKNFLLDYEKKALYYKISQAKIRLPTSRKLFCFLQ